MSDIPAELAAHFENDVTTLCHCWRLTRQDGLVLGFTDHDRPLLIGATRFEPQSGFTATEARQSLGLTVDTVDVSGALSSDSIDAAEIEAGKYDRAEVETLLVNWRDPANHLSIRKAVIGRISRADGQFTAELESDAYALDKPDGRYFRKSCDAAVGDEACGFDLSTPGFHGGGEASQSVSADVILVTGLTGFADGWFAGGMINWTSGSRTGKADRVASHVVDTTGTRLTLDVTDCSEIVAGDQFDIVAGCDKRFETCRNKFSNVANFRGFPHLPGNDAAYAYASDGQVFDGGPLVP